MYCHLCRTEMSVSHDSSSGHDAAKELVAAALDRLSNHLAASADSVNGSINISADAEKESVKTPEAVSFCDTCNTVYPINEQSSHYRLKKHALQVLNEQTFEELVQAYIGEDQKLETPSEASDDVAYVDEAEAVKTYKCHLCALDVPRVFITEHERSSRHRASRTFAIAAARLARDMLAPPAKADNIKISSKVIKKLLKSYTGRVDEEMDKIEDPPTTKEEPNTTKPEKMTPKEYFTEILPYLPYVNTFNTLYIDKTEFVTIKIGNETLTVHVNNINGLFNIDWNNGYYMNCRLCDSSPNVYYSSIGQHDKNHVMSLGHIKNVLTPFENVHLVKQIDDTHSICALCNVHVPSNTHAVDNHIYKDTRHTIALTEALERGKGFKETKDHLKIMIYVPLASKSSQVRTKLFGVPHQRTGLFGTQNSGFGAQPQNSGFGAQSQNTAFGTAQTTGFGAQPQNSGLGAPTQTGSGSAHTCFGAQTQNSVFGNAQNAGANKTGFGSASFWNSSGQSTSFGGANAQKAISQSKNSVFGAYQNNTGNVGNAQNSATVFGAANTNNCGAAHNNSNGFGVAQNNTCFGAQNNSTIGASSKSGLFSALTNANGFGVTPKATGFGGTQNNASDLGANQNKPTGFGVTQSQPTGFGATKNSIGANNATGFGVPPDKIYGLCLVQSGLRAQKSTGFGNTQNKNDSTQIQNNEPERNVDIDTKLRNLFFNTPTENMSTVELKAASQTDKNDLQKKQASEKIQPKMIDNVQKTIRRINYSSSSSDSD